MNDRREREMVKITHLYASRIPIPYGCLSLVALIVGALTTLVLFFGCNRDSASKVAQYLLRLISLRARGAHCGEEPLKLGRIQLAVGSHPGTHIERERCHLVDRFACVLRRETSS
jgi:hypothetical protein